MLPRGSICLHQENLFAYLRDHSRFRRENGPAYNAQNNVVDIDRTTTLSSVSMP
jgi:hypothetical protein